MNTAVKSALVKAALATLMLLLAGTTLHTVRDEQAPFTKESLIARIPPPVCPPACPKPGGQ